MSAVSAGPGSEAARQLLYRRFHRLHDETFRLSEQAPPAADYYRDFLKRAVDGTRAVAGAVWQLAGQGTIRLESQINLAGTGLEASDDNKRRHDELLRQTLKSARPLALPPFSGGAVQSAGNPTPYFLLLAPMAVQGRAAGLVEVWLDVPPNAEDRAAFAQFLAGMAHYASIYQRNRQLRELRGRQQLWTKLESFSRQVHASLDLRAVAYRVANEGRPLVACDRLSVVAVRGRHASVEAVSGVDVIDRRSNQVQLLGRLCARVLPCGEKLVYRGVPDAALAPDVLAALDAYLAICNSKRLTVLPLAGEGDSPAARFALVAECFEPGAEAAPMTERLEVVGRHAGGALANAARYRRIPLRSLWEPLGRWRDAAGGPTHTRGLLWVVALLVLLTVLVGVRCSLKMEAAGQLLPRERRCLYSPVEGQVVRFGPDLRPGSVVQENQPLVLLYDVQLELKLVQLANEAAAAQDAIAALSAQQGTARTEAERSRLAADKKEQEYVHHRKLAELQALRERTHSEAARPGYFWLRAPLGGTVLSWEFRETLTNRTVKPSEPLLRIGDKSRGWEVELKVPHRQAGPVLEALAANPATELDVDLVLTAAPTRRFRGKLARDQLAGEAGPDPDGDGASVVRARVRIDGPGIAPAERIPAELLLAGTAVRANIRCGNRRLGYALFYGLWEFVYEKVLLF